MVARGVLHATHADQFNCPDPTNGHLGLTDATRICTTGPSFSELSNTLPSFMNLITG